MSLQQMVLFGQNPSQGTLLKASQFLAGMWPVDRVIDAVLTICDAIHDVIEELPVRLAHRVKELDELPHNLSDMPSIIKVKNWYAQSFQVSLPLRHCSHHSYSYPLLRLLTPTTLSSLSGTHRIPTHHPPPEHPARTHDSPRRRAAAPRVQAESVA